MEDGFETSVGTYVNRSRGTRFTLVCSDMVRFEDVAYAGAIIDYTYELD